MKKLFGIKESINRDETRPNILFALGGPGTGKTTLCKAIALKFDYKYVHIDELINKEKSDQSLMKKGYTIAKLSELFNKIIRKTPNTKDFLLEGFVPTVDNFLKWKSGIRDDIHIVGALYFHCPEETMKFRLFHRKHKRISDLDQLLFKVNSYQLEDNLIHDLEEDKKIITIETEGSIRDVFLKLSKEFKDHELIKKTEEEKKKDGLSDPDNILWLAQD